MKADAVQVLSDDPIYLKYFTVKLGAHFNCKKCTQQWSSHHVTIKIDLFLQHVQKKYKQACIQCKGKPRTWVTPLLTSVQFKTIIKRVIQHYHERKAAGEAQPIINDASHKDKSKPHPQGLCERYLELKRHGGERQSCVGYLDVCKRIYWYM